MPLTASEQWQQYLISNLQDADPNVAGIANALPHVGPLEAIFTPTGLTPLHIAVLVSTPEVVRLLLEHGANPEAESRPAYDEEGQMVVEGGRTAVAIALLSGRYENLLELLNGGAQDSPTHPILQTLIENEKEDALSMAVMSKYFQDDRERLNHVRASDGASMLHFAVMRGNLSAVRILLSAGANVNVLRAEDGAPAWLLATQLGHEDILECLIEHGADPALITEPHRLRGDVDANRGAMKQEVKVEDEVSSRVFFWEVQAERKEERAWQPVMDLADDIAVDVASLDHLLYFATRTGHVWQWSSMHAKRGGPLKVPQRMREFENASIVQIRCGFECSLAVDAVGTVYTWGMNGDGRMGLPAHVVMEPNPIRLAALSGKRIASVSCGGSFALAMEYGGKAVYGWGNNTRHQLGHRKLEEHIFGPQLLLPTPAEGFMRRAEIDLNSDPVREIATGVVHSMILTVSGVIYAMGSNEYGQCGQPRVKTLYDRDYGVGDRIGQFTRVDDPESGRVAFESLSGGGNSSFAMGGGGVYVWGDNSRKQLGLEASTSSVLYKPTRNTFFDGTNVRQISCGVHHGIALTSEGVVYGWGTGLNSGPPKKSNQTEGSYSYQIAAGTSSCLAVAGPPLSTFGQEMYTMFDDSRMYTDVVFLVENIPIHAHRVVIAARCPVLCPVLGLPPLDSLPAKTTVPVEGVTHGVLHSLLGYLYSDVLHTEKLGGDGTDEVAALAQRCGLTRLAQLCSRVKVRLTPSTLSADMLRALEDPVCQGLTDVDLSSSLPCDDGEIGPPVPVHRVFLYARCEYFRTMMLSGMRDADSRTIELHSIDGDVIRLLVRFLYGDVVDCDPTGALSLLTAASEYLLPNLERRCEMLVRSGVNIENVAYVYQIVRRYNAPHLIAFCENIILEHFPVVIATECFAVWTFDELRIICTLAAARRTRERPTRS